MRRGARGPVALALALLHAAAPGADAPKGTFAVHRPFVPGPAVIDRGPAFSRSSP